MAVQRFGSEFKEQVVREVVEKDRTIAEVARSCGLVPWGGGELGQEMAEGPLGVCGLRGRCGAVGGEQEAARLAARGQEWGSELREKRLPYLRPEGPGRRPVRAASTAVDRRLPDHHDVPLSESIQVRVLRLAGPGAIKNRATQERAQRLDRVGLQQLPRHLRVPPYSRRPGPQRR